MSEPLCNSGPQGPHLLLAIAMMHATIGKPVQRLLTIAEAAAYCRLTKAVFQSICPVATIQLSPSDRRLDRYDLASIDEWIDRLKAGRTTTKTKEQRLSEFSA